MKTLTKEMQAAITPTIALELLKEGNKRFVSNLKVNRNLLQQANETSNGQHPFAAILSCIDSRTSAEIIFDQGLGDIFSIRVAGNVVNNDILGSMEFCCKVAGAKMIVVLGHTKCGAIRGACADTRMGHLTELLERIKPVVEAAKSCNKKEPGANVKFTERVAVLNVKQSIDRILKQSAILRELVETGKLGIIGAMYDLSTGVVTFYPETLYNAMDENAYRITPDSVMMGSHGPQ
jgi:carbonic anhydrase